MKTTDAYFVKAVEEPQFRISTAAIPGDDSRQPVVINVQWRDCGGSSKTVEYPSQETQSLGSGNCVNGLQMNPRAIARHKLLDVAKEDGSDGHDD